MSAEPAADLPPLRCPACRAEQTPRDVCRRCGADLSLLSRAHRRVEFLRAAIESAAARGDRGRETDLRSELATLAPRR